MGAITSSNNSIQKKASICGLALATVFSLPVDAGKGNGGGNGGGKGNINPYELSLTALQDVTGDTDVSVDVKVVEPGFSDADSAKHIQMKSFNLDDEVEWTKNLRNVGLTAGSVNLSYGDMVRYQPVQAQVQVQNDETGDTEVLKTKGNVYFRPDLSVSTPQSSYEVLVGETINIVVNVDELNGDLGAETTLSVVNMVEVLDYAENVSIEPMSENAVIFSLTFDSAGVYDLTAMTGEVNPGDFDSSNNSADFTVTVTEPVADTVSVPYWMHYNRNSSDYYYQHETAYEYHENRNSYTWEYYYSSLNMDSSIDISFPVDKVSIELIADNNTVLSAEFENVTSTYSYNWGCYRQEQGYINLAPGVNFYLGTAWDSCNGYVYNSWAQVSSWTSSSTYYSYNYNKTYGTESEYSYEYGQEYLHMNASSEFSTNIVIEDGGTASGGLSSVSLNGYSNSYDNYYSYGDGYYYQYINSYEYYYGYSSGMTE